MGGSRYIFESSVMLANQTRQGLSLGSSKTRNNQPPGKSSGFMCSYCGETGHSKQRCYEIIGYPEWWDFTKKPRKKIVRKAMVTFTQVDQSPPTANVTQPGDVSKAFVFSTTSKNSTWIIDTSASDHMTKDSNQLQSFFSSSKSVISTVNNSTSPISGEGSVILSNTLTLDIVLVVPSLEYNLLSVGQITSTLNYTVTFWPLFCVFQDILTRKILGYGVRRGNLYYLELTENRGMKFS